MAEPILLRIHILGPPAFSFGAEDLAINRLQYRALLYRLAAQANPVARDHLVFLFWPDIPDNRARRNLTQLLSHVRRALPDPDLLVVSREHVTLDPDRIWSDTATFEQICSNPDQCSRDDIRQAVSLYRDTLLAGVSLPDNPEYESWLAGERYRFERLYLDTLNVLLDLHMEEGKHAEAIEMAQRYLAVDELAEDVHRRLMECHLILGNRSAALSQYERCAVVLEQELGVEPLPETQDIYQTVLAGKRESEERTIGEPFWTTLPGLDVPMVGRDDLLQQMSNAFRRVQTGQGQIILLTGEAGIGKSRLLQEFAGTLIGNAEILVGSCNANIQSIPYQPIVEALRPHLLQSGVWRTIGPTWLQHAALLFPEFAQPSSNGNDLLPGSTGSDPAQARSLLFEALHLLVEKLSNTSTPVLLCLDDLHWADSTTIDWLVFLVRKIRRSRLLVIGAYRSEEPDVVNSLCREVSRSGIGAEYQLSRLDCDQVAQILTHAAIAGGEDLAQDLCRTTGGNPFFLMEVTRVLVESGNTGTSAGSSELLMPDSIREAVERRLGRLQPVARQVLEAAAVWGNAFDFDAIRQIAGRSEAETADGLDELAGRQVLMEEGEQIRFRHDLFRGVVYEDLSQWRRRLLHRRVAEAMEAGLRHIEEYDRASLVTQIGHHFAQADESDRAVSYLIEAGDHARNLYDDRVALTRYERALSLLRQEDDHSRTARTLMKIGLVHHNTHNFAASREAYEEGFRLFHRVSLTPPSSPLPPAPHPLRIVYHHLPSTFTIDPVFTVDSHARNVLQHLFSGLVSLGSDLDVVPDIAYGWSILDGGRTYEFRLRPGVNWNDGMPVTAEDFESTWRRILDPETEAPQASLLYDIRGARAFHRGETSDPSHIGIHAPDPLTLVIELEEPTGHFLHILTDVVAFPTPIHLVEKQGTHWTEAGRIATNGAFTLSRVYDDGSVRLARSASYHGSFEGNIDEVIFSPRGDWPDRLDQYRAGEIDVLALFYPPSAEVRRARQEMAGDYVSYPTATTELLFFDTTQAPLDDVNVRQALAMAVDKEELANIVMEGFVSPAHGGLVPPAIPGHTSQNLLPHDTERARNLLADAAISHDHLQLELTIAESFERVGAFLQSQWQRNLGVHVAVTVLDWPSFFQRMATALPQMSFFNWRGDYPDPDAFLGKGPSQVYGGWEDEVYDWLYEQAKRSLDQSERLELYSQMDRMLIEEAAIVPLAYPREHLLIKPWVKNYPVSALVDWYWKDAVIEPH